MRSTSFCWLFAAGVLACAAAPAERLRSPWDATEITPTDASYTCPTPPAFAKTLNIDGYYTDKQASIIDPKKLAAFNTASEGPTHLGQYTALAADAWLSKSSRGAAACVYSLLDAAAKADAWDGKMPQIVDIYVQNWMLSGTAIAYLKVRSSHTGTPDQDANIQKWFRLVAARVREYFDMQRTRPGSDAYNNHMYWAGLAVAAQGIADNDLNAFQWGLETYRMGVDAIQPDGSLTAEMDRAAMALHYQVYALGPLVMLAELGEANGIDMYGANHGAIHRLVKFDIAALADPSILTRRTGVAQNISQPYSGLDIGWAVPYAQRFPDPQLSAWIAKAPWVRFWQWGGAPPGAVIPLPPLSPETAMLASSLEKSTVPQPAAFAGLWCGQGDPSNHATITANGTLLKLAIQNDGRTAAGQLQGSNGILVPAWDSVTGVLVADGSQINWSNGTFWARCDAVSESSWHHALNLTGTWNPDGIPSLFCSIRQRDNSLQLRNESGNEASGQIDGKRRLTTDWSGTRIEATVSGDGNRIDWDNGTWWIRIKTPQTRGNQSAHALEH